MSETFHTNIISGAAANALTFNTPLEELDAALAVVLDPVDSTLKAGAVDVAAVLADNVVTAAKIAAAVAGDGLSGGGGTALSVNVDGTTIETNADALRVKALGIGTSHLAAGAVTTAKIAADAVTATEIATGAVGTTEIAAAAVTGPKIATNALAGDNIVWDHHNNFHAPGFNFDGKTRWFNPSALSLVNPDTSNPTGNITLRLDASITTSGGKYIYLADTDIKIGATPTFAIDAKAASGTWRLSARPYDSAGVVTAGATNGSAVVMSGTEQTMTVTIAALPANTVSIALYAEATVGTATLDIYEWRGSNSTFLSTLTVAPSDDVSRRVRTLVEGIVPDPTNKYTTPGTTWGGRARWINSTYLSIVDPDTANVVGGRTLRFSYQASPTLAGRVLWLDEMPAGTDDKIVFTARVLASGGTGRLAARFYLSDNTTTVGAQISGPVVTFNGAGQQATVAVTVPATAAIVWVYVVRSSGTAAIDIHALSGRLTSLSGAIAPSSNPTYFWNEIIDARDTYDSVDARISAISSTVSGFPSSLDTYGRFYLQDTQAQLAKINQAVSGEQLVIGLFGDSWVDNKFIHSPLVTSLQALYGNAGAGWISFYTGNVRPTTPSGTSLVQTGTWTSSDQLAGSRGVDIAHVTSTDIATPGKYVLTTTSTDISVHYLKQSGGGSFRWNVDGGGWTTVSTANATDLFATLDITGLSNASHILTIEVTVAGTGVTFMGADCKITGSNGVRIHKLGNGGLTAGQAVAVDATIWEAGIAALAPNLVIILLGTNDHSQDVVPATFSTNITTLITRIRAARANTDILLLSPADNDLTETYLLTDYVTVLRDLAVSEETAMVDFYLNLPDYTIGNARGLYSNTTHLNASGGQLGANLLTRMITAQ